MKILITGAAGGIGSTLGYELFRKGYEIILIDNFRNGYEKNLTINGEKFGTFYCTDINSNEFFDIVLEESPDIIIHLAAITSLPDCELNSSECLRINVEGTNNVILAGKTSGVKKIIFSSTSAVYENTKNKMFKESDSINPRLFYSLSKKMAEEICISYRENYGMNIIILRFFNVFGPRQDIYRKNPPLINYLIKEYLNNKSPILHSDGNQTRDYIHVDCVSNFIIKCIENDNKTKNFIFNLCSGKNLSVRQITNIIKKELNVSDILVETYKESDSLWNTHSKLFTGKYPLKKEIVSKETNKCSRGNNYLAKTTFKWNPNINLELLISNICKYLSNEKI
jgi:UDP-glucose 4-epimerase